MAFPTVASVTKSSRAGNGIDDVVNFETASAGDLILVKHFKDGASTDTHAPAGSDWVAIKSVDIVGTAHFWCGYLIASGGESSVTITSSNSERFSALATRIPAAVWHGTTPPEISSGASGTSAAPDPDALTPSWPVEDTLFMAIAGCDINAIVDGFPANYNDNQTITDTVVSCARGGIATRELAASSDDPGAFSLDGSEEWGSWTLAVRLAAAAAVDKAGLRQTFAGVEIPQRETERAEFYLAPRHLDEKLTQQIIVESEPLGLSGETFRYLPPRFVFVLSERPPWIISGNVEIPIEDTPQFSYVLPPRESEQNKSSPRIIFCEQFNNDVEISAVIVLRPAEAIATSRRFMWLDRRIRMPGMSS